MSAQRIYSLDYTHDKKHIHMEVGKLEPLENTYEVIAIFQSNSYVVFTKTKTGANGVTILVSKDEVEKIVEFEDNRQNITAMI
ncbi:MAG: hypothetical protein ACHQUB_01875 [Candidatus Saccharimonadia bacterium]